MYFDIFLFVKAIQIEVWNQKHIGEALVSFYINTNKVSVDLQITALECTIYQVCQKKTTHQLWQSLKTPGMVYKQHFWHEDIISFWFLPYFLTSDHWSAHSDENSVIGHLVIISWLFTAGHCCNPCFISLFYQLVCITCICCIVPPNGTFLSFHLIPYFRHCDHYCTQSVTNSDSN